jgi:hypothetical protein
MLQPPLTATFEAAPLVPVLAPVSLITLARFRRLMAYEGWTVDLSRMCCDRLYAYERIAQAHTSAQPRLREAALGLFAVYEPQVGTEALH